MPPKLLSKIFCAILFQSPPKCADAFSHHMSDAFGFTFFRGDPV
jgi:hypothetical protein